MLSCTHQCLRDKDGYHWLTGRVDDVINVRYFLDSISFAHIIFYVFCVSELNVVIGLLMCRFLRILNYDIPLLNFLCTSIFASSCNF